jgi:eukaryotic-like serine/threonine-protein kinase
MHPESLGGYRVVRKLGIGARAEVFLGISRSEPRRTVALKHFLPSTAIDSIEREVEVVSRIDHPHVVHLADLATTPNGRPCLILERLEVANLANLLEARTSLAAGEAVTILAPLAAAVSAVHSDGVAHLNIRPSRVLFRGSGAPVLSGFGHAKLIRAGASIAALAEEAGVASDYRSLGRLARTVCDRVPGQDSAALAQWLDELDATQHPDSFADVLADRIFELGAAEPVRRFVEPGESATRESVGSVPARIAIAAPPRAPTQAAVVGQRDPVPRAPGHRLLTALIDRMPVGVSDRIRRVANIRRPVWLVAGSVAIVVTIALLSSMPEPRAAEGGAAGGAADGAADGPTSASAQPTAPATFGVGGTAELTTTDPIDAVIQLLTARSQCIRDLSVLCLDAVDQSGSAAMDDDVALIRTIEQGGEVPTTATLSGRDAALVERNGDAALVSLGAGSQPGVQSVLLIRGDSGWRIRDYFVQSG